MMIAVILFLVGFCLGFSSNVFILIPIGAVFTISIIAYWMSIGLLDLTRIGVWAGYIAALNTGFLVGTLFDRTRKSRSQTPSAKKKTMTKAQVTHELTAHSN